eukprot:GGOE01049448.1.p1 GENE.GGOE01049448.1~~GGOE01049448.1.p1  ORF type:complete len:471 (+),score=102.64 GGOE01049448.1:75-1415(+)
MIAALQMLGKAPPVTAADVRAANERQSRLSQLAAATAGRQKETGITAGAAWEKARALEAEESSVEEQQRLQAKMAHRSKPEAKEAVASAVAAYTQELTSSLSPRSAENHVLLVSSDSKAVAAQAHIKEGTHVVVVHTVEEAHLCIQRDGQQMSEVNTRIIVIAEDNTEPESITKLLQLTSALPKPPPVLLVTSPMLKPQLLHMHHPPYVVVTSQSTTVPRFVEGTHRDFSAEEEAKVRAQLVRPQQEDSRPGEMIAEGVEHDIRMRVSREPVEQIKVSMHWIGQDLDISCILLDKEAAFIATVSFLNEEYAGAFKHSGDILRAPPPGATEAITVTLSKIPPVVAAMYFVITSFSGEPFSEVQKVDAQLTVQSASGLVEAFAEFPLQDGAGQHRAMVIGRVSRTGANSWAIRNCRMTHETATTARRLVAPVQAHMQAHPLQQWDCGS